MFGFDAPFKALADAKRRQILDTLRDGPMNAGDLAAKVGIAPNALSFHLKVLKNADLVADRRQGQFVEYTLNTSVLEDLAHFIYDKLADRASNKETRAESTETDTEKPRTDAPHEKATEPTVQPPFDGLADTKPRS